MESNIKIDLKEISCMGEDEIQMTELYPLEDHISSS